MNLSDPTSNNESRYIIEISKPLCEIRISNNATTTHARGFSFISFHYPSALHLTESDLKILIISYLQD